LKHRSGVGVEKIRLRIPLVCRSEVCRFRVQESTPEGVSVFQWEPEQDQESVFLIGTGSGAEAGVILSRVFLTFRCIFAVYINCYTGVKFCLIRDQSHTEQESIFEA